NVTILPILGSYALHPSSPCARHEITRPIKPGDRVASFHPFLLCIRNYRTPSCRASLRRRPGGVRPATAFPSDSSRTTHTSRPTPTSPTAPTPVPPPPAVPPTPTRAAATPIATSPRPAGSSSRAAAAPRGPAPCQATHASAPGALHDRGWTATHTGGCAPTPAARRSGRTAQPTR